MPFKADDVEKHNKRANTPKLKRLWVSVANNALIKCEVDKRKNCDAEAIRMANGVIKERTKSCRHCDYHNLEWCTLHNKMIDERCKLFMPTYSYLIKTKKTS